MITFVSIAAMNPYPCGYYGDPAHECTCSAAFVSRYRQRIPGPLLDRIDIHVGVPRVEHEKLADVRQGEDWAAIRKGVKEARDRQRVRFRGLLALTNGEMGPAGGTRCPRCAPPAHVRS